MNKKINTIGKQLDGINQLVNRVPGALIYKGNKKEAFSIEVIAFDENNYSCVSCSSVDMLMKTIEEVKVYGNEVIWINVMGLNNVDEMKNLGSSLSIDHLLLEQILNITDHSMYKISENRIFSDLQMIFVNNATIKHENISLLLTEDYIISFQERVGDVYDELRERIKLSIGNIRSKDKGYTYFCLLDALIDNYLESLEVITKDIEIMEETVINAETLKMNAIHDVRKQIMRMKFSANPIEKMIQQLLAQDILGVENRVYIESINHHIKEVQNELLIQKEMINGVYENYILNNSNDMNKVMTTLTIFSAIFIPLSFMAGVFGMNFEQIPGLSSPNGFLFFMLACIIIALGMVSFFKIKDWF